jgi:uncharacterized membrane protein
MLQDLRAKIQYQAGVFSLGAFGAVLAAWFLAVDDRELLLHPDVVLPCDVNTVLSCSAVAKTWQATLFNFMGTPVPNAYIGLVAETVFVTIGVALLGGATFPKWFMRAALAGVLASTLFSYWLFYQEVFAINALCPWCMCLLFSQTLMAFSLWRLVSLKDYLFFPPDLRAKFKAWSEKDFGFYLAILWFLLIIAFVIFWYGSALFG